MAMSGQTWYDVWMLHGLWMDCSACLLTLCSSTAATTSSYMATDRCTVGPAPLTHSITVPHMCLLPGPHAFSAIGLCPTGAVSLSHPLPTFTLNCISGWSATA